MISKYDDEEQTISLWKLQFSDYLIVFQTKRLSFRTIGIGFVNVRSFVRHKISSSSISKTVRHIITKFRGDFQAGIIYSPTGYDIIICFRSEVTVEKQSKIPPTTASRGISQERFKLRSWNLTCLSKTNGPINLPDRTSLAASGRLQNVIIYCTKVRKTGPGEQRVE